MDECDLEVIRARLRRLREKAKKLEKELAEFSEVIESSLEKRHDKGPE